MRKLLNMLKKDDNTISVGRLCAVLAFLLFAGVSLYLAILVKTWGNYEAFAMACVSFMVAQLGNKYVETRMVKIGGEKNGRLD